MTELVGVEMLSKLLQISDPSQLGPENWAQSVGDQNNHDRARVKMLSKLLQISDPMIAKSVLRSHLGIKTEPTI